MRLSDFFIADAQAHGLGKRTKETLAASGYVTAADFTSGGVHRVWNGYGHDEIAFLTDDCGKDWLIPGLGPVRLNALLAWRDAVVSALADDENAWVLEFDDETRGLAERTNDALARARELEGTYRIEIPEDARRLMALLTDARAGLVAIRAEHRSRVAEAKRAYPGWRRSPVARVAIAIATKRGQDLRADLSSMIKDHDRWLAQLSAWLRE